MGEEFKLGANQRLIMCPNKKCSNYNQVRVASLLIVSGNFYIEAEIKCMCGTVVYKPFQ